MRLPKLKSSFMRCVQIGRYVLAKLRSAGKNLLADGVAAATDRVLEAGRGIEDAVVPVNEAIAHRDWAVAALENAVRDLRLALMSRGRDAVTQPPYTHIFPDGISIYISAPLDETVRLYQGLIARIGIELDNDDAAGVTAIEQINTGLKQFGDAVNEVNSAKNAVEMARTHSETVRREWNAEMMKVYASLLTEYGKKGAEQFFPKWRVSKRKTDKDENASTVKEKAQANGKDNATAPDNGNEQPDNNDSTGNNQDALTKANQAVADNNMTLPSVPTSVAANG